MTEAAESDNTAVPFRRDQFFEKNVAPVLCDVRFEPYDSAEHVLVEITTCDHMFGKVCLQK